MRNGTQREAAMCVTVLGCISSAGLAHTPAHTVDRTEVTAWVESGPDATIGWEFDVESSVVVTAIGIYDRAFPSAEPGLGAAREVGLWDAGMNLLATTTIAAGGDGNLCEDDFRYAPIPATMLEAGQTYVVAVFTPTVPFDHYPSLPGSGIEPDYHASIQFVQSRTMPGAFGFPTTTVADNSGVGVVNFRIDALSCEEPDPPNLVTLFESDNELAGNMFDLTATDPDGLVVNGWHVNLADPIPVGTPVNITIYWRTGSFEDAMNTADGWNELGSVDVIPRGPNRGTPVPLGGLVLPFGQTIGIYIYVTDYVSPPPDDVPPMLYTNQPPAGDFFFSDRLELTGGIGKSDPPFVGFTIPDRMWNGGIVYDSVLPGDVNGDGIVDVSDLTEIILNYGPCGQPCPGDTNGDGTVDVSDIVNVVLGWS